MKSYTRLIAGLAALVMILAACGEDTADTTVPPVATAPEETTPVETTMPEETTTPDETTMPEETTPEETTPGTVGDGEAVLACQVTDVGGIDDASFNQTAWQGVLDAVEEGIASEESDYLESQGPTDYGPNLNSFVQAGCDLIISVGFLLADDTAAAAEANPDQSFEILDFAYDPPLDNVLGAVFDTTDAAFLAGYLAAGVSETGVVATYGGIPIPCAVTCFMDGFYYGVQYYNEENGTDVTVLGWDPADPEGGVFTGDFENLDNGRNVTQSFVDEGADVILPVAGPVGEGSLALAQELGNVWVVGVDADWFLTLPAYSDVILTSVLKGLDVAVTEVIRDVSEGTFQGGTREFTIEEDGVGIGQINEAVDPALVEALTAVEEGVKDGSIAVGG